MNIHYMVELSQHRLLPRFETLKHLRLFFYTHPVIKKKNPDIIRKKNAPRNNGLNGVVQVWGEHLYRDEFKKKSCPHIHDCPSQCDKCQEGSEDH